MKLGKTLLVVACAGLLSATVIGVARHADAQDAGESQDVGSWNAAGSGSPDESSSPDAKAPPLNIQGCWFGSVTDIPDGEGDATFEFVQNGKKIVSGSSFDFEWPDMSFAVGPIKGTVSSNGFKFKGTAGKGCSITGSAHGDALGMEGTFHFHKKCGKFFKSGPFSISPC